MAFARDFSAGLSGFSRAFGFVRRNGMAWMFLVPSLLWVLLTFSFVALLKGPVDELGLWLAQRLEIPIDAAAMNWWTDLKAFLNGAREFVFGLILRLAVAYLLYITNKYIVLILLSPLLAYASERTEEILTHREFPFSWAQLLKDAFRGALLAGRNGVLEISITIAVWALTLLFPILAPLAVILLFVVSSYFYGFSMFDYVFERKRMRIGERVKAVNWRFGAVLANGALFGLLMKLPLVGVMFAPVLAAVGGALTILSLEKEGYTPSVRMSEQLTR